MLSFCLSLWSWTFKWKLRNRGSLAAILQTENRKGCVDVAHQKEPCMCTSLPDVLDRPHLGSVFPLTLNSLKFLSYCGSSTKSFNQRTTSSWVQLWTNNKIKGQQSNKNNVYLDEMLFKAHLLMTSSPSRAPPLWCAGLLCGAGCVCESAAASCLQWWTAELQKHKH